MKEVSNKTMGPDAVSSARRRLSVTGSAIDIDGAGLTDMDVEIPEVDNDTFVGVYYGQSKKGFAPYNAHKVNQDCMLVKEDTNTGTLILGAFDGHGQHGQCVSEVGSFCSWASSSSAVHFTTSSSIIPNTKHN